MPRSETRTLPVAPAKPRRKKWLTAAALLLAATAVVLVFTYTEFDWAAVQRTIADQNPFLLFALIAILPVFGFSVGVVYLVAGARFGAVGGGAIIAAATAIHLLATHWISRSFLRGALERLLTRRGHRLPEVPEGGAIAAAVMAALVPVLPYFARNYLLALSNVPFRIYFPVCLPIYVARSYVTIFLGDLSKDPDRTKFFILVAVYAVKLGVCAVLLAHLRKRYQQTHRLQGTAAAGSTRTRRKKTAGITGSR